MMSHGARKAGRNDQTVCCDRCPDCGGKPDAAWQDEPAFTGDGRGPTCGGGRVYAYGREVLFAADAKTGAVVESFGNKGRLQVADAIRVKYPQQDATGYEMSSPPAYYNGTLYVGL